MNLCAKVRKEPQVHLPVLSFPLHRAASQVATLLLGHNHFTTWV